MPKKLVSVGKLALIGGVAALTTSFGASVASKITGIAQRFQSPLEKLLGRSIAITGGGIVAVLVALHFAAKKFPGSVVVREYRSALRPLGARP